MINGIIDSSKIKIVKAIKEGLFDAHTEYNNPSMRLKNGQHFYKMDKVGNEVIKQVSKDVNFKIISIKRGSYELALFYYIPTGSIFTLMSKRRFVELMGRSNFVNVHYLDALVELNSDLECDRNQLKIDELVEPVNEYEKNDILKQIRDQLDGDDPSNYATIVFDMRGYELISVESVLTSEDLEVVYTEEWSQFIELDYRILEFSDSTTVIENEEIDLGITIKPNVVRKDEISINEINPKNDSKEHQV